MTFYYIRDGFISRMEFIGLPFLLALAWWFGKHYDIAKFLSENDALTGVYNRRYCDKAFNKLLHEAKLKSEKLGIFIIDIDNFKSINDTHGHSVGDLILKDISKLLMSNTRKNDCVFRWGGDEFLILTPNMDRDGAKKTIERINEAIEIEVQKTMNVNFSISGGFAIYPEDAHTFDELLSIADKKMYQIKKFGT